MADNSDWVRVGGNPARTQYVDANSIGTQGKFIVARTMTDFAKPAIHEGTSTGIRSQITLSLHDCRARKFDSTHITSYSGNMGRGDLLMHSPYTPILRDVVPGSIGERQLNFVCNHPAAVAGRPGGAVPATPQPASAKNSGWYFVVRHGALNVFVDNNTIKKLGGNRASAWVLGEYPSARKCEKTGEFYRSITALETYDCKGNRLGYTEYLQHAESMGLGKVVLHEKDMPINYVSLEPDSIGEIRLKHVCTHAYR